MKDKEIVIALDKVYHHSEEKFNNVLTPFQLTKKMFNSLNYDDNKSILVLVNLEFLLEIKKRNLKFDNVYYSSGCKYKKQLAKNIGVNENNIYDLEYNNKEINVTHNDMTKKFDYMVGNPPYNPNSLWKKFVLKGINMLKNDGKMIFIHPDTWRVSNTHKKLCNHLKEHISELHITGFTSFPGVGVSTDWYLYHKSKQNSCTIYYENGDIENKKFEDTQILSFSNNSIPGKILSKICTVENNGIIIKNTGFGELYNNYIENGKYKQCGGKGRGTNWTKGDYHLTDVPTEHQFENKVVMCYTRKPRAKYFSKEDEIGVLRAHYWLTDNKSLPILLNSKMIWKLGIELTPQDPNLKTKSVWTFPTWFLQSLNFENLDVQTEEELYEHYNLTEEEINWIENIN